MGKMQRIHARVSNVRAVFKDFLTMESEPEPKRVTIPVRALGIPKVVVVNRGQ